MNENLPHSETPKDDDGLQQMFRVICENIDDAVYVMDVSYKLIYYNETFLGLCRQLGFSQPDLDGIKITDLFPFRKQEILSESKALFASGVKTTSVLNLTLMNKDVTARLIRIPIINEGAPRAIITIIRELNVTTGIDTIRKLDQELLKAIVDNSPIGISIRSSKGQLIGYNRSWKNIWQLSDEDIKERVSQVRDTLTFDNRDSYLGDWLPKVKDVYLTGADLYIPALELFHCRRQKTIWVSQRFYAIKNAIGEVERVVILTEDITERKQAEKSLRLSEEKHRGLVSKMPLAIGIIDRAGQYIYLNEFGSSLHNLHSADVVGKSIYDLYEESVANQFLVNIRRVIDTGEEFTEETHFDHDGQAFWFDSFLLPYYDSATETSCAMVIANDITDRKRAEIALRVSEEKYRSLVSGLPVFVAVINRQGVITFINEYGAAARGLTPIDVIGRGLDEFYDKEFATQRLGIVRHIIETGQDFNEEVQTTINGEVRWHKANVQPHTGPDGTIDSVMLLASDITERKRAEIELQESEKKYRILMKNVPANIAVFDYSGVNLFINDYGARTLNKTPDEIVGRMHWELFSLEIADQQMAIIRKVIDSKQSQTVDSASIVNGKVHWFTTNIIPYRDLQGNVIGAMIIANDITRNKEAEQALKYSEEKLRSILSSMDDLVFLLDKKGVFIDYYQPTQEQKLYVPKEEFIGRTAFDFLAPEICSNLDSAIAKVFETEQVQQFDYFLDMPQGRQWFNAKISLYRGIGDQIDGVTVVSRNITDRKGIEEELLQSQKYLESRVKRRTLELGEANDELRVEREALRQKNIALQEVLNQIEDGKSQLSSGIEANVERIIMPIVNTIESRATGNMKNLVHLLKGNLKDITSPFLNRLETTYSRLTPRELEICTHIKNGFTCKEIAGKLGISDQTVLKQRAIIRSKLGLKNKKTNLASFLKTLK